MAIQSVWDNEQHTILYVDRTQKFTWNEFDRSVDESYLMISAIPHTVDMVIRIDQAMPIPPNPMPHMKRMFQLQPKNLRYIVLVGVERTTYNFQTVVVEMLMRVFSSVAKQMRFASSMEDARAMLAQASPAKADTAQQA